MTDFSDTTRREIERNLQEFKILDTPSLSDGPAVKPASVALIVVPEASSPEKATLLLTRRAAKLNTHAGQWALPGGRQDAGENALEAAMRETQEEVGLSLSEEDLLGQLDPYPTRSGYLISPFVFWPRTSFTPQANPEEVASLHYIPLTEAHREGLVEEIQIEESSNPVLRLHLLEHHVHAPTAAPILQFFEVGLKGRQVRVAHYEQPVWAWR